MKNLFALIPLLMLLIVLALPTPEFHGPLLPPDPWDMCPCPAPAPTPICPGNPQCGNPPQCQDCQSKQ